MGKEVVTTKDVEHIMKLSRLEFDENEKEIVKKNLNDIVDYFGILSEVDTTGLPILNKPEGNLREDEVKESLSQCEVVKNAPMHSSSAFIVPRVVE